MANLDQFTHLSFDNYPFHNNVVSMMKRFPIEDIPNICIHGPPGAGKRTLTKAFLNYVYQTDVNAKKKIHTIELDSGSNNLEIDYLSSGYHYELFLHEYGLYDRHVLTEFLKHIVQYKTINNRVRIVVLHYFEWTSNDTQLTLRRMMEVYSKQIRFILLCDCIDHVEQAILSRVLPIRIGRVSHNELCNYIRRYIHKPDVVDAIIQYSQGNLSLIKWLISLYRNTPYAYYTITKQAIPDNVKIQNDAHRQMQSRVQVKSQTDIPELNIQHFRPERLNMIIQWIRVPDMYSVIRIRELCYEYLLEHYPLREVYRDIVQYFIRMSPELLNDAKKHTIVQIASEISTKMANIEHDIIGIELLALKIKKVLFS